MRGTPVLGVLSVAGEWGWDGRPPLYRAEVAELAGLPPLPLRVDHQLVVRSSGVVDVGRAVDYRYADGPPRAEVLLDVWDAPVAAAVERGELTGLSLGQACGEVSLTFRPAYSACRILCWGPAALAAWGPAAAGQHQAGCRAVRGRSHAPPRAGSDAAPGLARAAAAEVS